MTVGSDVYTITATYDENSESNNKWNITCTNKDGKDSGLDISTKNMQIEELQDIEYSSGKIEKVESGSKDQQGYFQTNTVTKTGQVTGKEEESSTRTRIGDVVKASTSKDGKTLTVSVNGERASLTDTDTQYELKQSTVATENKTTISLVDSSNGETVSSASIKGDDTVTIENDGKGKDGGAIISVKDTYYQTDDGKAKVKPGQTLGIKGGSNISTSVENGEIKVGLKDDINVKSITAADGKVRIDRDGTVRIGGSGNNANTTLYEDGTITSKVGDTTLIVGKDRVSMGNGNNQVVVTKDGVGIAGNTGVNGNLGVSGSVGVGGNLAVAGDIGATNITASETVSAKNITASENVNAKNINASESVNVGNTSVKSEGITIKGNKDNNSSIVFTQDKIDMGNRQIHGVAAGTADTDAVNFAQLKATEANFNQKLGNMDKHINRVEDNAYAGVAMALATAGLPQAWQPGKSMIAAAAGTYMGEQGYAIGFSHNTENGKWTLKATASGNSQGHFGGTVGAGYMW